MVMPKERDTMKRILFTALATLLIYSSFARAEIQIIQVKRNLPLSDDEPVYKDYYLSGGKKSGLRENLVVPVWRWVNLRENNQAQDQSMKILEPVGWLKVIFVQDQLAVARLYENPDFEKGPIFDQPGVMIGDIISLEHSYMSKPNYKMPKDSAQLVQVEEPHIEPHVVAIEANVVPALAPSLSLEAAAKTTSVLPEGAPSAVSPQTPAAPVPPPPKLEATVKTGESVNKLDPNLKQAEGPKPASLEKSIH
jgi:hypothetical protein